MKTTILVSRGNFPDIRTAAFAEQQINWWDNSEIEAQTTCTVAWTATELDKLLPFETELRDAALGYDGLTGTVLLLGSARENPAIASLEKALGRCLSAGAEAGEEGYRMCGVTLNGVRYIVLSGNTRTGIMYAAFAYCERRGLRFLEPGAPSYNAALVCDEVEFDITEAPAFTTRGTFSSYITGDDDFLEWMAHNRMNFSKFKEMASRHAVMKKLGIQCSEGGHELYYRFVETSHEYPYKHALYGGEGKPDDPYPVSPLCRAPSGEGGVFTYGDAHPEWYALVDGVRRLYRDNHAFLTLAHKKGDNYCTGNPDARAEMVRLVTESLIDGVWKYADYIDIWALDNGAWCECELCKAQGNFVTRLLLLAYEIDKSIKKAQAEGRLKRSVKLICPAYHETLPAPDKPLPDDFDYSTCMVVFFPIERCFVHHIDDPACRETNALLTERLMPWTKEQNGNYKGELFIGEYYNVSTFAAMPFVLSSHILHDIPFYYRMGARHFHYMHISARDWGFIAVNNWLYARLLWDVNADGEGLLSDYFTARYGPLSSAMRALYGQMEKTTANCKYYKHYQFVNGRIWSLRRALESEQTYTAENLFPLKHMQLRGRADDPQAGPSLEETLIGLEKALAALEGFMTQDLPDDVRAQLNRDHVRLSYGVRMTRFLYLMCLVAVGEATKEQTDQFHALARQLEASDAGLKGYDLGENMDNELNASFNAPAYRTRFC